MILRKKWLCYRRTSPVRDMNTYNEKTVVNEEHSHHENMFRVGSGSQTATHKHHFMALGCAYFAFQIRNEMSWGRILGYKFSEENENP